MSTPAPEPFADNWSYLRLELNWLDHLLMAAVARQRKQSKDIDRIAQTKADRVSSHWWQGIVSLEGRVAYEDGRKPPTPAAKLGYQQQLDLRVRASQAAGIVLALPLLRDRLSLTLFEKNLILLCLAPEVNHRYARIYRYLKGEDSASSSDLPNVDLSLRLLCRNDGEWSQARRSLTADGTLLCRGLIDVITRRDQPLLSAPVRLADPLVDLLLSDRPSSDAMDHLIDQTNPAALFPPDALTAPFDLDALIPLPDLQPHTKAVPWSEVVLPPALLHPLQQLAQRLQGAAQIPDPPTPPGLVLAIAGATGTGKMTAVHAIATQLATPVVQVDLAHIEPDQATTLLHGITTQPPRILAIKTASRWFGRSPTLHRSTLQHLLHQRRQQPMLTVLICTRLETLMLHWRQQMDHCLTLPLPTAGDRLRLWHQALPPSPALPQPPWQWLADHFPLSGGQIGAIAQAAASYAAADGVDIQLCHLLQALYPDPQALKLESGNQARYTCSGDRLAPCRVDLLP
jgi:hypothetical protein